VVQYSYSVRPIVILRGRITVMGCVDRLDNQVHPMIQTLFPNKDAVFQDDNAPIHTTESVQSWFEEHECNVCIVCTSRVGPPTAVAPRPSLIYSMNVNFYIFPGQILTSLNHFGQIWRLEGGTDSHLQNL
jgi:hypothetical protein